MLSFQEIMAHTCIASKLKLQHRRKIEKDVSIWVLIAKKFNKTYDKFTLHTTMNWFFVSLEIMLLMVALEDV